MTCHSKDANAAQPMQHTEAPSQWKCCHTSSYVFGGLVLLGLLIIIIMQAKILSGMSKRGR